MSEPFIGQIMLVPYNFAPRGWAFCNGQILPIAQNTALFSLLGTTYGGNGQTTFALPDLRGRVPVSSGQGPGLQNYDLGQVGGSETQTLTVNEMPLHNHTFALGAIDDDANLGLAANNYLANVASPGQVYRSGPPDTTLGTQITATVGGNQPVEILQPYLGLNYCIALEGIFPSRN